MVSKAVRETHAKLKKNINRLVGSSMTPPSVAKIEVLLDLVEHVAVDNPTINFHLHMSGYDLGGKVFWVPIFEDQVVLDSPAKRVLNMVYRYIESADSMLAGSTTLLEAKPWVARAKSQSFKKSRPRGLPPSASNLTASSTPPATGAPSAGGAPPAAPPESALSDDPDGAVGNRTGSDDAATDEDAGSNNSATDMEDEIKPRAAPTGGRNRLSAKTCPETATAPLPVIPSQATKNVVMEFLSGSSKPLTLMRTLVPAMVKSVCNGATIAKIRVSRRWWPKTDKGELWEQSVEVDNKLLRSADKTKGPDEDETLVRLRRMLATRSAPATERVADMLLMVEREPNAKATLIKYNLRLKRRQLRRTVTIAPMTCISFASAEPAGQSPPAAPAGHTQPSAPTGQFPPTVPGPAAVPRPQRALLSLAAAAAASGRAQGSALGAGYGLDDCELPQGPRPVAPAFDQIRVREALAAAKAAI